MGLSIRFLTIRQLDSLRVKAPRNREIQTEKRQRKRKRERSAQDTYALLYGLCVYDFIIIGHYFRMGTV